MPHADRAPGGRSSPHLTAVLALLFVAILAAPPTRAAPCTCEHLKALKVELRNARTLQTRFQQKAAELRSMGQGASAAAVKAFAEGPARRGIEASPGYTGPSEVDFVPHGDNVSVDAIGRRSNAELCEYSSNTRRDLERAAAGSQCQDIADAIRVHEAHHHAQCLASGYRAYVGMHGADRAMEEAAAYGAQAARLREGIRRVLANAQVEVLLTLESLTTVPPNPLYTGIEVDNKSAIRARAVATGADELRFEGQGEQISNMRIRGGNCTMRNVPIRLQNRATVITDGETARVSFLPEGTVPSFGMVCRIPGAGTGHGMSMPVPVNPSAGAEREVPIPFDDGEKTRADLKDSEAARILAGGGIRLTGFSEVEIRLRCDGGKP